jgi:trimethylamine--corrinoid protein Co-methyltransferase
VSGSYEKLILDAKLLQSMTQPMAPMVVNEDTLGFDAIKEVGPGGYFFVYSHTLERYENAFYHPILAESRTY